MMLVAELAQFYVRLAASTVHRILLRRGISRLQDLDVTRAGHAGPGLAGTST